MPLNMNPQSQTSAVILPASGASTPAAGQTVISSCPFGAYTGSLDFITGAAMQVDYVYKKLGGDVLDIEITTGSVFSAYEEAVLEYSYIVNIHQSKNILHSSLGATTGTFNSDGQRTDSLSGSNVELKFPRFKFGYARNVMDNAMTEIGAGGNTPIYSASFDTTSSQQDYNLQTIVSQSSTTDSDSPFYGKIGNKRILIKKVVYKTPHAMWRFYGYYGGMNSVGNLSTYGMYADDSTFEVIPPWHNKLQAMAYEDAIYTRNSHYSYEIKNIFLRIYPIPSSVTPVKVWFDFVVENDPWDTEQETDNSVEGVNNMSTLPLSNIPFANINSIGKQWIRRFALALSKETLGQIRSKFGNIPIPGNNVTLNGAALLTEGREEQKNLREELQKVLDELTYQKLTEIQSSIAKNTTELAQNYPYFVYVG